MCAVLVLGVHIFMSLLEKREKKRRDCFLEDISAIEFSVFLEEAFRDILFNFQEMFTGRLI